jgi:hypothetical protein
MTITVHSYLSKFYLYVPPVNFKRVQEQRNTINLLFYTAKRKTAVENFDVLWNTGNKGKRGSH